MLYVCVQLLIEMIGANVCIQFLIETIGTQSVSFLPSSKREILEILFFFQLKEML